MVVSDLSLHDYCSCLISCCFLSGVEDHMFFIVSFTESVPKPVITIETDNNPDVVYLRCGYSGTIIWKNSSGDTLKGTKNHNPGEFITVTNTRNTENFYTCTLKNDVSEETSDPVSEGEIYGTGKTANYFSIKFQRRKSCQITF